MSSGQERRLARCLCIVRYVIREVPLLSARPLDMSITVLSRATTALHRRLILPRRVQALAENLAKLVPSGATSLLDVGCAMARWSVP